MVKRLLLPYLWITDNFCRQLFDFLIIAFAIFFYYTSHHEADYKAAEAAPAAPPAPPAPTKEEVLLTEIRDLLKEEISIHNY